LFLFQVLLKKNMFTSSSLCCSVFTSVRLGGREPTVQCFLSCMSWKKTLKIKKINSPFLLLRPDCNRKRRIFFHVTVARPMCVVGRLTTARWGSHIQSLRLAIEHQPEAGVHPSVCNIRRRHRRRTGFSVIYMTFGRPSPSSSPLLADCVRLRDRSQKSLICAGYVGFYRPGQLQLVADKPILPAIRFTNYIHQWRMRRDIRYLCIMKIIFFLILS